MKVEKSLNNIPANEPQNVKEVKNVENKEPEKTPKENIPPDNIKIQQENKDGNAIKTLNICDEGDPPTNVTIKKLEDRIKQLDNKIKDLENQIKQLEEEKNKIPEKVNKMSVEELKNELNKILDSNDPIPDEINKMSNEELKEAFIKAFGDGNTESKNSEKSLENLRKEFLELIDTNEPIPDEINKMSVEELKEAFTKYFGN